METRQREKPCEILSDEAIIDLYLNRHESAIFETEKKYRNYLYAIAFNILGSNEDCEECLNDTYLKTWNAIPPTMPRILRAFLGKIMRNTSVDRYDEAKRQRRVPAEICDSLSDFEGFISDRESIDSEIEAQAIGEIITSFLDGLSDRKLYIFMSRYYFAMPIKQIAVKLDISESTVAKELSKIKNALRKKLAKGGIEI